MLGMGLLILRLLWLLPGLTAAIRLAATTSTPGIITSSEKLKIFPDNLQFGSGLTGSLVLPLVEIETAFDVHGTALFHIFADDFRLAAPESDIDKGGLFPSLPVVEGVIAIDRETDVGHG